MSLKGRALSDVSGQMTECTKKVDSTEATLTKSDVAVALTYFSVTEVAFGQLGPRSMSSTTETIAQNQLSFADASTQPIKHDPTASDVITTAPSVALLGYENYTLATGMYDVVMMSQQGMELNTNGSHDQENNSATSSTDATHADVSDTHTRNPRADQKDSKNPHVSSDVNVKVYDTQTKNPRAAKKKESLRISTDATHPNVSNTHTRNLRADQKNSERPQVSTNANVNVYGTQTKNSLAAKKEESPQVPTGDTHFNVYYLQTKNPRATVKKEEISKVPILFIAVVVGGSLVIVVIIVCLVHLGRKNKFCLKSRRHSNAHMATVRHAMAMQQILPPNPKQCI
uniref:Uncharacterized protein n=1 Tax=Branchiostoma floridae TaxID=7739 RepID=C3Z9E6_BRAFL|eukprot:XP_002594864.1 hypothetical protein BRAFLDRAFT_86032 [Branchiostoma floridae]